MSYILSQRPVVRKALFIIASFLLPAVAFAQDILPVNDLPVVSVSSATNTLLFNTWVRATVESHNPLLQNDSILWFDFDKLSQRLLVTADKETEIFVDRRDFQSVTFHFGISAFTLTHVPEINDKDLFFVVIRDDRGYSLYKLYRWEASRQGYRESVDYFIVFPFPDRQVLQLRSPDKRQLDRAFQLSGDKRKLDRYFDMHKPDVQDEHFLKNLVDYLNE